MEIVDNFLRAHAAAVEAASAEARGQQPPPQQAAAGTGGGASGSGGGSGPQPQPPSQQERADPPPRMMHRLVARLRLMKLEVALLSSDAARAHAHTLGMRHTLARLARLLPPPERVTGEGGGVAAMAAAAADPPGNAAALTARGACDQPTAALAAELAALLARDTGPAARRPGRMMAGA
jgi:hypothetical protein